MCIIDYAVLIKPKILETNIYNEQHIYRANKTIGLPSVIHKVAVHVLQEVNTKWGFICGEMVSRKGLKTS